MIDLKIVVMVVLAIDFIVMLCILATEDDVVIVSVMFGLIMATGIFLDFVRRSLDKYITMESMITKFLLTYEDVSMDEAISGFGDFHVKDITVGQLSNLRHRVDVTKSE